MLTEAQAIQIFERCGALIRNGHFAYTSGRHGREYVNKDGVYPHTALIAELCQSMSESFVGAKVEVVLGPALGGIILSQWTAHHLSQLLKREVLSTYAEKSPEGDFVLRRGYENLVQQKKTLIVEDVLTTGGSVKKVVALAQQAGAEVVGVAALANRGGVTAQDLGVQKLTAQLQLTFESWEPSQCPFCQQKIPLSTSLGKQKP